MDGQAIKTQVGLSAGHGPSEVQMKEAIAPSDLQLDKQNLFQPVPIAIITVGLALILLPLEISSSGDVLRGAGLGIILIGLYASGTVKDYVAALAFFAAALIVAAIPPTITFSGFSTSGTWLIFSGMILAASLKELGLADQIAARSFPSINASYFISILTVSLVAVLLVIIVPSTVARVLLLVPITLTYATQLGYPAGSRGATGLVFAGAMTTYYCGGGVLTAALPNVAMVSLANELMGIEISFQEYLFCAFPVLTFGTFLLLVFSIWIVFRSRPEEERETTTQKPMSGEGLKLIPILAFAVIMWSTDRLHGISPAWISLVAALLCLWGPAKHLSLASCVKIDSWVAFTALLSLGAVLHHTQSTELLGRWLVDVAPMRAEADWLNLATMTAIGAILSVAGTNLAAPVLYTALAEPISNATGWPVEAVLFAGIPSWTFVLFAFQAPFFIVAMKMANIPIVGFQSFLLSFSCLALLVIVPAHFLWIKNLGYLDVSVAPSKSPSIGSAKSWKQEEGQLNGKNGVRAVRPELIELIQSRSNRLPSAPKPVRERISHELREAIDGKTPPNAFVDESQLRKKNLRANVGAARIPKSVAPLKSTGVGNEMAISTARRTNSTMARSLSLPRVESPRSDRAAHIAAAQTAHVSASIITSCEPRLKAIMRGKKIEFGTGSAIIDSSSRQLLEIIALEVANCPRVRIEIAGHTDSTGDEDRNKSLSKRRAVAVRNYLIEAGINKGRLTAVGYGESNPIASNASPESRARNRRIEFSFPPL